MHLIFVTEYVTEVLLSTCVILMKPFDTQKRHSPVIPHLAEYSLSLILTLSKLQSDPLAII